MLDIPMFSMDLFFSSLKLKTVTHSIRPTKTQLKEPDDINVAHETLAPTASPDTCAVDPSYGFICVLSMKQLWPPTGIKLG